MFDTAHEPSPQGDLKRTAAVERRGARAFTTVRLALRLVQQLVEEMSTHLKYKEIAKTAPLSIAKWSASQHSDLYLQPAAGKPIPATLVLSEPEL